MYDIAKMGVLNEVFSTAIPQKVDYEVHNGRYSIELLSIRPIIGCNQCRDFIVSGNIEEDVISATLATNHEVLFSISNLPYIAHEGDHTPIYKIVRASVLFAYGTLWLPCLHRNLKKIPIADYPFFGQYNNVQTGQGIGFMKKLSAACRNKEKRIGSQVTLIHPSSSRLKEIISFYDKEEKAEMAILQKIKESIDELRPFASGKEDLENAVPDVLVWEYDADYPKEKLDTRVIVLNVNSGGKEKFWWDYLKLNLFLSDVEYSSGYYILMNRWKITTIQKWIAEYRAKGLFESKRAKDYMVIYLKTTEKSTVRILNSDGNITNVKVCSRHSIKQDI